MENGLEVYADKTKYVVMSRNQKAKRNHNIKTNNSSFERVEEFEYWELLYQIKILFRKKLTLIVLIWRIG